MSIAPARPLCLKQTIITPESIKKTALTGGFILYDPNLRGYAFPLYRRTR